MRKGSKAPRRIICSLAVIFLVGSFSEARVLLGPPGGPKYLQCPTYRVNPVGVSYQESDCNEDLAHAVNDNNTKDGCKKYCAATALSIEPAQSEGCVGQPLTLHVRTSGGNLGSGNAIVLNLTGDPIQTGEMDWNDTKTSNIWRGQSVDIEVSHTYQTAGVYYPSAVYGAQFKYDGQGSCSYVCNVQAQAKVTILLATDPKCGPGQK